MKTLYSLLTLGILFLSPPVASAALTYVESISGDLSGVGTTPSVLDLSPGLNQVSGTMGSAPAGGVDSDIFSFVVGAGESVDSIRLSVFTPVAAVNTGSFFAIDDAATIAMGDGATHAANQLVNASSGEFLSAAVLFGPKLSGGASSLSGPLGPGTYTLWFRETSTQVGYTFDVNMVPEPGVAALLLPALGLLARRRRAVR